MTKSVCWGRTSTFRAVCAPALVAVVGVTILLSGCSKGASEAEVAQAKQDGAQAQAQKDSVKHQQDTQASLMADITNLKDAAAKDAEAKTAATSAAAAAARAAREKIAADQAAAAKAAKAQAQLTSCGENVSVPSNTTCDFALNVKYSYNQNGGGNSRVSAYSPTKGEYYLMTCTSGVPVVCRGGNNAVVYIR